MNPMQYLRPERLDEALGALGSKPWTVLAGGTDFYPARVGRPVEVDVIDITRIADLRGIRVSGGAVRIGATATWSELIAADLPPICDGLKAAAREVGGVQIQNAGTVAGNLCNASPAADGVPPLLALGAEVELASGAGSRRLPLGEFVLGNRRTARRPDELVVAVHVPAWPPGARGEFLKLGHRRYLVISIVMVAACVALDAEGRITRCGVSVGACSAAAKRLTALEERLAGMRPADAAASVTEADLSGLTPIADVRGSAEYRLDAAATLVRQAIAQAGRR
jgi:CO/xanthine dehydrogenase FAD-binding subunit